ncbi:MAG: ABC transporter ATP-binding protein [Prosthecobacter sp.]|jgi:lipoprotein-releasing system ATP-binding protein|uniref:ABC transporter ATP-binding protein n=1 Tax=Prosthecobacter sp. TaxID=1965333 RepID=UPI0019F067FD|nr:ABC transporter ATP-binding protein [Prosthecobacter sp.]MBE2283022.1 ABC transporter ATP-binding protein [Prosthecobacter sp.]
MSLIQLTKVTKSYLDPGSGARVPVLRGITLGISAGESVAIVGPSGCGKSTLLNILGTLDSPDEGSFVFDEQDLTQCTPKQLAAIRSQKIGFIFQLHHLMPQCSVLENVLLPTLALKSPPADAQERAQSLLEQVGLKDRMSWKPAQLSGGERQRVAFVRALINQPRVILADEPTGALDEANAATLTDLLLKLQQSSGVTLVMVTHHRAQAERMNRVMTIHEGVLS